MTISQERNSPAYSLFKESKKHIEISSPLGANETVTLSPATNVIRLSTENAALVQVESTGEVKTVQNLDPMAFTKQELDSRTDEQIKKMFLEQKNSTLLGAFKTVENKLQTQQGPTGIVVRGSFELRDGVGIVDHLVSLNRFHEGQFFELGQVDLKAGLYQIVVNSFEGELVAEIKDKNGYLIGEDRQEMSGLRQVGSIFEGPSLKLGKPSSFSFNPRFADDRRMQENENGLSASFFSGNYDLKKTNEDYPNVARQSLTVGFVHDPTGKLVNTLSIRSAKDPSETVLFSKLWVDGARNYISEKIQVQFDPESGTILGRIVENGNPVPNVRITIDDQPGVEVYYLDDFWIPQSSSSGTSKNGYFFVPGLTKGPYQLSSFDMQSGRNRGSQLFVVDENTVSYQEILYQKSPSTISFMSYDAFTSQPMAADLALPADENVVSIDDSGLLKENLSYKLGTQEIVVRPPERNYMAYTTVRSGGETYFMLPQVQEEWLKQISIQAGVKVDTSKSVFIGFTSTSEFSMMMADTGYDLMNRIYFSASGQLSATPVIGGGVIFFNISEGLHEVVLHETETMRVHARAFFAKSNRVYVSVFKN